MNILICSAGRRVKLVKYFHTELSKIGGKVIAVDCDYSAPALQFAHHSEVVPRISDLNYVNHLKTLCRKYNIQGLLSLIDPELSILSSHKNEFEAENVKLIISNKDVINICFDKYLTYRFLLEHSLPAIQTYIRKEDVIFDIDQKRIDYPLVMKPRMGSASIGMTLIHSKEELDALWKDNAELIIQPFINENEYGIDCYIDLINFEVIHIFGKRKIKMRAGETDKSIAVHDHQLFELIEKLVRILKPIGPIDIDCFKTNNGYIISEINPRFGGGYPHAHEMGQNFVKNIIRNVSGIANDSNIGKYSSGSVMIKFDDIRIFHS